VEGDDGEPAAGLQDLLGRLEAALQFLELLVEMDPDRLEGARGRILLLAGMMAGRLADDVGELAGALDRTGGDDGTCDAAGLGLLAIAVDDVRDDFLGSIVEEVGGALPFPAHPHVERPVGLEGEAAVGLVELHRGDADIEGHPVDLVNVAGGKRLAHPGETLRNKRQAPPARSGQSLAILDRFGIAIESDDSGRPFIQDGLAVAAGAERAVDMGLAGGHGESGNHLIEEHRDVRGGSVWARGRAHGAMPFSSRRYAAISRRSGPPTSMAIRGFQTSTTPPIPTKRARSSIFPLRRIIGGRTMRPLGS
jgi:hypothetical protein